METKDQPIPMCIIKDAKGLATIVYNPTRVDGRIIGNFAIGPMPLKSAEACVAGWVADGEAKRVKVVL